MPITVPSNGKRSMTLFTISRREPMMGIGRDVLHGGARGEATAPWKANADGLGVGREEVAREVGWTLKPNRGLPRSRDIARRGKRNHGLLARRAVVGVRISAL